MPKLLNGEASLNDHVSYLLLLVKYTMGGEPKARGILQKRINLLQRPGEIRIPADISPSYHARLA